MVFFGLGTLPSMLAAGYAASWINGLKSNQKFRKFTGALLILFGLWTLPLMALTGH
jgi:sulfite exporter TauE/SafE